MSTTDACRAALARRLCEAGEAPDFTCRCPDERGNWCNGGQALIRADEAREFFGAPWPPRAEERAA